VLVPYFLYAVAGKVIIFLWQKFPVSKWKVFAQVSSCDLCLGVWIYSFLAVFFGEEVNPFIYLVDKYLDRIELTVFVYFLTCFLTGAVTSFLVHLISLGWNSKFQVLEIN